MAPRHPHNLTHRRDARPVTLAGPMQEIAPGIFHWTAFRETISQDVHSYYVVDAVTLVDPMEPEQGLDWFAEHGPPERILLTNRHHYRHSGRFADRFGCRVLCHKAGL